MASWKETVSAPASTVNIRDITNYVQAISNNFSPIDSFYNERNQILRAITPEYSSDNPLITPLVMVGLISITENYFREIFSGILQLCPIAKEKSAAKSLNLGTAWFGYSELEKGSFENISFSDADTIKKNLEQLANLKVMNNSQISTPLQEFAKLCELRHAIVHSASLLAGKNAIKLQLPKSDVSVKIKVGYAELQEAAQVCTSLVCSVNLELFESISRRWMHEWPRLPAYVSHDFHLLFKQIWKLFYSDFDSAHGLITNQLSLIKTKNQIIRSRAQ